MRDRLSVDELTKRFLSIDFSLPKFLLRAVCSFVQVVNVKVSLVLKNYILGLQTIFTFLPLSPIISIYATLKLSHFTINYKNKYTFV